MQKRYKIIYTNRLFQIECYEWEDAKRMNKFKESFTGIEQLIDKKNTDKKMVKKDWMIVSILMAFVILFTFINFGTMNAPETGIITTNEDEYVIVEIPAGYTMGQVYFYAGISQEDSVTMQISSSKNGDTSWVTKKTHRFENGDMYRWNKAYDFESKTTNQYVKFTFKYEGTRINEIVIEDSSTNEPIPFVIMETNIENAETLFDEGDTFEGGATNTNGMIFDEIYFARTAFEIQNDMPIYETTHPHLGKILIGVGISIFGMNPFGWRIVGALFSIASVFLMYVFGKRVFKSTLFASVIAVIFATDGLRYVQGRMGTADSFIVFFMIVSYYFIYQFYENGIDVNAIKRSMMPFALSGIFIGLAFSVKWTGLYAMIGLFFIFLIVTVRSINKFLDYNANKNLTSEDKKIYKTRFINSMLMLFVTGLIFFVIVPIAIYYAVFAVAHNDVPTIDAFIQTQINMFSYHSNLSTPHNSSVGYSMEKVYIYI